MEFIYSKEYAKKLNLKTHTTTENAFPAIIAYACKLTINAKYIMYYILCSSIGIYSRCLVVYLNTV